MDDDDASTKSIIIFIIERGIRIIRAMAILGAMVDHSRFLIFYAFAV